MGNEPVSATRKRALGFARTIVICKRAGVVFRNRGQVGKSPWDLFAKGLGDSNKGKPPKAGMNQDVYTLSTGTGALILQWPIGEMTTDDLEDVELWLDMMKRKIKRAVQKKELEEAEQTMAHKV